MDKKHYHRHATAELIQDFRRQKKDDTYPVKLRIYFNKKKKLYATGISLTKKDFDRSWNRDKPKMQYKETRIKLEAIHDKAKGAIEETDPFTFDGFERAFFGTSHVKQADIFSVYRDKIDRFRKFDQHGTADWYKNSMNSLKVFLEHKSTIPELLSFETVSVDWLHEYENYMLKTEGKSRTTLGMYLRALRSVFNTAIEEGYTSHYPFGRRKYQIPNPSKVKKALTKDQMKLLKEAVPEIPEQAKARDWFMLSYYLAGVNLKDLLELTPRHVEGSELTIYRAKTSTTNADQRQISIPITQAARAIINRYRRPDIDPDSYLFDIVQTGDSAERKHLKKLNFLRFINQHLKPLAKLHGLPEAISYQWARHSFNTISVRGGASMEWVQSMMGHSSITTTQNYFAGFAKEVSRDIMERNNKL